MADRRGCNCCYSNVFGVPEIYSASTERKNQYYLSRERDEKNNNISGCSSSGTAVVDSNIPLPSGEQRVCCCLHLILISLRRCIRSFFHFVATHTKVEGYKGNTYRVFLPAHAHWKVLAYTARAAIYIWQLASIHYLHSLLLLAGNEYYVTSLPFGHL